MREGYEEAIAQFSGAQEIYRKSLVLMSLCLAANIGYLAIFLLNCWANESPSWIVCVGAFLLLLADVLLVFSLKRIYRRWKAMKLVVKGVRAAGTTFSATAMEHHLDQSVAALNDVLRF